MASKSSDTCKYPDTIYTCTSSVCTSLFIIGRDLFAFTRPPAPYLLCLTDRNNFFFSSSSPSFLPLKVPLQEPHQGDRQAYISRFAKVGTAVSYSSVLIRTPTTTQKSLLTFHHLFPFHLVRHLNF